jgi:hypothetical protein
VTVSTGDSRQTGPDGGAVRGQHHLSSAFEDLDFLPHGPRLPIGVRRGSGGGEDGLAGCGDVEVEGAKRPGPAANAQVEGESAGDHADVRTAGHCAGEGSTARGNQQPVHSRGFSATMSTPMSMPSSPAGTVPRSGRMWCGQNSDRSSGQYEIGPAVCCWALISVVAATGQDVWVVTVDDVRAVLARLPRSSEVLVRDRVKFRVGQIVYVAFSQDETEIGFAFPKEERAALVAARPDVFFLPRESELRFHWIEAWLDALDPDEMRELVLDAWRMVVPQRVAREVLGPEADGHEPGRIG